MVPPVEFTAKFPVMELFPGKLTAVAWIARFVSVIELPTVPITDPLVLSASEVVPPGVNAAVTFIVPELDPPTSPILTTVADRRSNSASTRDSRPAVSVPRSICRLSVAGLIVTAPELAVTFAPIAMVSAFSKTAPELEVIDPVVEIDDPDKLNPPEALTAPPITIEEGLEISATVPVVETPQF
jgi:hypothetical protein